MVAIYLQKTVHEGLWARRMALFFVQLLILTVLLHRFGTLATPAAMNLVPSGNHPFGHQKLGLGASVPSG